MSFYEMNEQMRALLFETVDSEWFDMKLAVFHNKKMRLVTVFAVCLLLASIAVSRQPNPPGVSNSWISSGLHDHKCFTQGLSFINATHILESCGLYGQSYFHILTYTFTNQNETLLTEVYKSAIFDQQYFLEGSILFPVNKVIYVLTWKEQVVFRFNSSDYSEILPRLEWNAGEGWGMTHNGTHIFISTGSNELFVVDENINILQTLPILDKQGNAVKQINEIQWVNENGEQFIYANIWMSRDIVKISLKERKVVARIEEGLMLKDSAKHPHANRQDVLNGIAFDQSRKLFVVTGKKWPRYYVTMLDLIK